MINLSKKMKSCNASRNTWIKLTSTKLRSWRSKKKKGHCSCFKTSQKWLMMPVSFISSAEGHWVLPRRTSSFCRRKKMLRILFLIPTSKKSMRLKLMTITLMKEKPPDSTLLAVVSLKSITVHLQKQGSTFYTTTWLKKKRKLQESFKNLSSMAIQQQTMRKYGTKCCQKRKRAQMKRPYFFNSLHATA